MSWRGDLSVAQLVECTQEGGISPGGMATEAGGPKVPDDGRELCQRKRRGMELQTVQPGGVELLEIVQPSDQLTHGLDRGLLGALVCDILTVGGPEGLVPVLPFRGWHPGPT